MNYTELEKVVARTFAVLLREIRGLRTRKEVNAALDRASEGLHAYAEMSTLVCTIRGLRTRREVDDVLDLAAGKLEAFAEGTLLSPTDAEHARRPLNGYLDRELARLRRILDGCLESAKAIPAYDELEALVYRHAAEAGRSPMIVAAEICDELSHVIGTRTELELAEELFPVWHRLRRRCCDHRAQLESLLISLVGDLLGDPETATDRDVESFFAELRGVLGDRRQPAQGAA